jgi:hypothetical protein
MVDEIERMWARVRDPPDTDVPIGASLWTLHNIQRLRGHTETLEARQFHWSESLNSRLWYQP